MTVIRFEKEQILNVDTVDEGIVVKVRAPFTSSDLSWIQQNEIEVGGHVFNVKEAEHSIDDEDVIAIYAELSYKDRLLKKLDGRLEKLLADEEAGDRKAIKDACVETIRFAFEHIQEFTGLGRGKMDQAYAPGKRHLAGIGTAEARNEAALQSVLQKAM